MGVPGGYLIKKWVGTKLEGRGWIRPLTNCGDKKKNQKSFES